MFIKRDSTDEMFFRDYLDSSDSMNRAIAEGNEKNYHCEDIATDVYSLLYKANPMKEQGQIPKGLALMGQALAQIEECKEFQNLRLSARLDPFAAGVACESLMETLIKYLPNIGKLAPKDIEDSINHGPGLGMPEKTLEDLRKQLEKISLTMEKADQVKLNQDDLRGVVRKALQIAESEVESTLDGLACLGQGTEAGDQKSLNLNEKMLLAKKLKQSSKLQEIMKIAGKFIRIAHKVQASKCECAEYSDIELGGSINRVLASETMKLAHPTLKGLFYKGILDKSLLQYKLEGKELKGKGPIIVCLDSSGSMAGEREIASKAIALAMLEIARMEKRSFVLTQFASFGQTTVFKAPKGKCNTMDLLIEIEIFLDGGTNFESPLDIAMVEAQASFKDEADIIFITDGEASLGDDLLNNLLKAKKDRRLSIFAIAIGSSIEILNKFCDQVFPVEDILRECPTDQIFAI